MPINYTDSEVNHILDAYKNLFPSTERELADYWDYRQTRLWSCLTTDFHKVNIETIKTFNVAVQQIDSTDTKLSHQTLGQQFKNLSRQYNVGYSLGISPWTDDLLLQTFSEKTKFVIIVLGHDWYPIVGNANFPSPPLQRDRISDKQHYANAIPSLRGAEDCAILFMNLYPDFREPGAPKTGLLEKNYEQWVKGLEAVCKSISQQYCLVRIISWGKPVWEALREKLGPEWQKLKVMNAVVRQYRHGQVEPIDLYLGGMKISYHAFAHPSFATNFKKESHWAAYESAIKSLEKELSSL